jgi:hypothetical protein
VFLPAYRHGGKFKKCVFFIYLAVFQYGLFPVLKAKIDTSDYPGGGSWNKLEAARKEARSLAD